MSLLATGVAVLVRGPGQRFAMYGRWVGLRAVLSGKRTRRAGRDLLVTPVHIVRYWEFPFVLRHVPPRAIACLDVGSPRLFSLYLASRRRDTHIRVINPDRSDTATSSALIGAIGLDNVEAVEVEVGDLARDPRRYDAIWSISVIEHIRGDGDRAAMARMYEALIPGGSLLVTVPVDRRAWDEYRDVDTYHLGQPREPQGYFFQRWYDEPALRSRLLASIDDPAAEVRTEWFGERQAGRFAAYERDWLRRRHARTVLDPIEIARGYRVFERWSDMPGQGVCGIAITKPG